MISRKVTVAVLHIEVRWSDPRRPSGRGWSLELEGLLGTWRSAVEASGGFVLNPEPHVFRVMLGLFQPGGESLDHVRGAVRHARGLEDMLRRHDQATGERLHAHAGVALEEQQEAANRSDMGQLISGRDADLAFRMSRLAAPGGIVLDYVTRMVIDHLGAFEDLQPIPVPGSRLPILACSLASFEE